MFFYTQPWLNRRQWHPTPVLLPGKSRGWRSLEGCSPWGRLGSDTTERLHFHFSLSCIGEGNGNPLQCSCLENPRDGEAWWAAVYGVTHSRTRLKWLSNSNDWIKTTSILIYWVASFYTESCRTLNREVQRVNQESMTIVKREGLQVKSRSGPSFVAMA